MIPAIPLAVKGVIAVVGVLATLSFLPTKKKYAGTLATQATALSDNLTEDGAHHILMRKKRRQLELAKLDAELHALERKNG